MTIKDVEKYLHIYDYSCICCHVQIILSTSASKEVWVIFYHSISVRCTIGWSNRPHFAFVLITRIIYSRSVRIASSNADINRPSTQAIFGGDTISL